VNKIPKIKDSNQKFITPREVKREITIYPHSLNIKPWYKKALPQPDYDYGIIQAKLNAGIGDLIYTKATLDSIKHRFKRIIVSADMHMIRLYRSKEYEDFVWYLCELMFSKPPYELTRNQNLINRSQHSLWEEDGFYPVRPNREYFSKLFCRPLNETFRRDYVVVTTKVRWFSKVKWEDTRNIFFNALNTISSKYDIMIMGEQKIEDTLEYRKINNKRNDGGGIYTIYKDLIKYINPDALIDRTTPYILVNPSIKQFHYDCSIMNKAQKVICVGHGGNHCLAQSISNCITFLDDFNNYTFIVEQMVYPKNDDDAVRDIYLLDKIIRKIR